MEIDNTYTYKSILQEVGKQIAQRKSLLLKRTLLIIWPFLALIIVRVVTSTMDMTDVPLWLVLAIMGFIFFATCYVCVMSSIFAIEKRIWLDSYFDKKNLTSSESWRIARKLLVPATRLVLRTVLTYYFVPALCLILGSYFLLASFQSSGHLVNISDPFTKSVAIIGATTLILALYQLYMQIRLRYLWFVFLDNVGKPDYSTTLVLRKTNELHKVSKGETFVKSLVVVFGTGVVSEIASGVVAQVGQGLAIGLGISGTVVGQMGARMAGTFGKAYAKQIVSLGGIAAMYILYMQARRIGGMETQSVNDKLYNLASA